MSIEPDVIVDINSPKLPGMIIPPDSFCYTVETRTEKGKGFIIEKFIDVFEDGTGPVGVVIPAPKFGEFLDDAEEAGIEVGVFSPAKGGER